MTSPDLLERSSRRLGPACLSDLVLDALVAGDLAAARVGAAQGHLEGCVACAGRLAVLQRTSDDFIAAHNLGQLAADAMARARAPETPAWVVRLRRILIPAGVALAGAVALVLVLRPRGFEETRPMGGGLNVYALHAAQGEKLGQVYQGEPLGAGDRIRFGLRVGHPAYVTVVAVDGGGNVSLYHPSSPDAMGTRVEEGQEAVLDGAVELDDAPGPETVIAFVCEKPIKGGEVLAAARSTLARAATVGSKVTDLRSLGLPCEERRATVVKAKGGAAR